MVFFKFMVLTYIFQKLMVFLFCRSSILQWFVVKPKNRQIQPVRKPRYQLRKDHQIRELAKVSREPKLWFAAGNFAWERKKVVIYLGS